MNLPKHLQEKLGYNVIHQQLNDYCVSELGKSRVSKIRFSNDSTQVQAWINQVSEFLQLIRQGHAPPLGSVSDISDIIDRAEVKGNWISGEELYKILKNITAARELSQFIFENTEPGTSLTRFQVRFDELKPLELRLTKSVDEEGNLLDSASSELKSIRQKIRTEEGSLRKKVNTIFRQAKSDGHIPEGGSISVRDGRMVIPVNAASKRQIQGFVHDESSNGSIVFLEPSLVLEANNAIRELQIAESREIHRILLELTRFIGEYSESLRNSIDYLGEIDFLWAKAKLARRLDGSKPEISGEKTILKNLRHPLLVMVAQSDDRQVIPHSLELSEKNRILLISGPNAGGKSVAMKSVGLC